MQDKKEFLIPRIPGKPLLVQAQAVNAFGSSKWSNALLIDPGTISGYRRPSMPAAATTTKTRKKGFQLMMDECRQNVSKAKLYRKCCVTLLVRLNSTTRVIDPPQFLKDALVEAIDEGFNQYCRVYGTIPLVTEIAKMYGPKLGREINPLTEILVSQGGNTCLNAAIVALVSAARAQQRVGGAPTPG